MFIFIINPSRSNLIKTIMRSFSPLNLLDIFFYYLLRGYKISLYVLLIFYSSYRKLSINSSFLFVNSFLSLFFAFSQFFFLSVIFLTFSVFPFVVDKMLYNCQNRRSVVLVHLVQEKRIPKKSSHHEVRLFSFSLKLHVSYFCASAALFTSSIFSFGIPKKNVAKNPPA